MAGAGQPLTVTEKTQLTLPHTTPSLFHSQMANVPDMPVAAPATAAPMAAMAEGLGGGGGGGGAGPSGGAGGGPSGGLGAGGGSGIDEDLQARLDNLRKS